MISLYVYRVSDRLNVAIITSDSSVDCWEKAKDMYGNDSAFSWTYIPAFGFSHGLLTNAEAAHYDCTD